MDESDRPAVTAAITAIIRDKLPLATGALVSSTVTTDVPGWDSLAHVKIILAIERQFKFRIRATEMAKLTNLGSLIDMVVARGVA